MRWVPITFELTTDIHRRPVPSARLRAVQKSPVSDSKPEDYHIEICTFKTGKIGPLDRSITDHERLYQKLLFEAHDFSREFLAKQCRSRWNTVG